MVARHIPPTDAVQSRVIWGARNIGHIIGLNEGQTHYLLEKNEIPGALKVGGRWCIAEKRLREHFKLEAA